MVLDIYYFSIVFCYAYYLKSNNGIRATCIRGCFGYVFTVFDACIHVL